MYVHGMHSNNLRSEREIREREREQGESKGIKKKRGVAIGVIHK